MPKGGKRTGAGRKVLYEEKKITLCLTVTPVVRQFLQSQTRGLSESVEQMVRRSKAFKKWKKMSEELNNKDFLEIQDIESLVSKRSLARIEGDIICVDGPYTYEIPLRDFNTPMNLINWQCHLMEKTWITIEHILDFTNLVCSHKGWDIHGAG